VKDKWLVTIEIETYDGDPKAWDWDILLGNEDVSKVISSEFKGRVLPTDEETLQERADRTNPYLLKKEQTNV
jgi:hypothetical protein